MDGESAFRRVDERLIHRGHVVEFWSVSFEDDRGRRFERDVIRHPGAVGVVALTDDGTVVMVRQFRAALGGDLLEIPAGKLDVHGEPPLETAQRELVEEVGYQAGRWDHLASYAQSPGFSDEIFHVFLARDLRPVARDVQGIEEEHMTIEHLPLADAPALIAAGGLSDGKSIIGLLLATAHVDGTSG